MSIAIIDVPLLIRGLEAIIDVPLLIQRGLALLLLFQ